MHDLTLIQQCLPVVPLSGFPIPLEFTDPLPPIVHAVLVAFFPVYEGSGRDMAFGSLYSKCAGYMDTRVFAI